ncbi:ornithine cyclodeaminase family protein [Kocuria palustris]|uniref:ornithine cyclodeaminase family protein n=1 Tax=Kocuria palustris TaxID=71999 RepID=UPI00119F13B6|nr:ornithine cyclodeaminase family protein [Kocuria palustris]
MSETQPEWFSTQQILERVSPDRARRLIRQAILDGFDPAADPHRITTPAGEGHLLLMPSTLSRWTGVKVASVSPGNPELGLPRIQATYLLLDSRTLTPTALLDGAALTELRTPAVSAAAADVLAPDDARHLVVFGTGPQAIAHVHAMLAIRPLERVTIVGRSPEKVQKAVAELAQIGPVVVAGTAQDAAQADLIVCATSAAEPLFDGSLVPDGACVIAMGSHEPDRRELDAALMGRSQVVVEDRAAALREAGDVVLAIDEGTLAEPDLVPLRAAITGEIPRRDDRPNVFKGTGMSWEDLAVAVGVLEPEA